MNQQYKNIAESLIYRIAQITGFTNDISLFEGKMGVAILLFHASRYFASKELESISESLIYDITDEQQKLYELGSKRESDLFWAMNHLFECGFIDFEDDFFDDIDKLLFLDNDNKTLYESIKYISMGNYITSRHKTSKNREVWNSKLLEYLDSSIGIIDKYKKVFLFNFELLSTFWYSLLYWDNKSKVPFCSDKLEEILLFFKKNLRRMPCNAILEPGFQFFNIYNKFEAPKHITLETLTISDLNAVYLNKFLYPNYIMPRHNQSFEILESIIINKSITEDLFSLLSFQNIGLKGYFSGLAWTMLQFLQSEDH